MIVSAGKDKYIKTWRLSDKWINEDVRKFEEAEIKNMSDTLAMQKIQKSLENRRIITVMRITLMDGTIELIYIKLFNT